MSGRTIVVGVLAAICGILATVGVTMLNQGGAVAPQQEAVVTIQAAVVEIETGQQIEANMLTPIEWHAEEIPPGAFADANELIGSFAIRTIPKGDLIVKNEVADQPTNL